MVILDWSHMRKVCVFFSECGQSPKVFDPKQTVSLIHAGHNSSRGDFPWMAALYTVLEEGKWKHICGGTLISPYIVLTGNIVTVTNMTEHVVMSWHDFVLKVSIFVD